VQELLTEFGKIDILVNNAGITRDGLLARMSDDDWNTVITDQSDQLFPLDQGDRLADVPGPGAHCQCRVGGGSGWQCRAGQLCGRQGGMVAFTKIDRREFARRNVTANVVAPGFIKTDMTATLGEDVPKGRSSGDSDAALSAKPRTSRRIWSLSSVPRRPVTSPVKFLPLTAAWRCEACDLTFSSLWPIKKPSNSALKRSSSTSSM
jgi:NAD(P)-dependent dehydrogenase (short-subunit alcohol dehydrogenase family)